MSFSGRRGEKWRGRGKVGDSSVVSHVSQQKKSTLKGVENDFDRFYFEVYGKKRWPVLREALCQEPLKVALYNRFCQLPFTQVTSGLARLHPKDLTQTFVPAEACDKFFLSTDTEMYASGDHLTKKKHRMKGGVEEMEHDGHIGAPVSYYFSKPPQDDFHIRGYYLFDYASALVVEQLHVGPFDRVLDLCAAPGGKSIAIAQFLTADGQLTANETLPDRCARLKRNLKDHLPLNFVPWVVTQRNGSTWHEPCRYTRVLIDAPCSSERHLLLQAGGVEPRGSHGGGWDNEGEEDEKRRNGGGGMKKRGGRGDGHLLDWQRSASGKLAVSQVALLKRGIEACCEGGRVVYSTCSISPFENDEVIAEALRTTRCVVEPVLASSASSSSSPPQEEEGEDWESQEGIHEEESTASEAGKGPVNGRYRSPHAPWISHASKASSRTFTLPPLGHPTEYGWMILPDTGDGWGPIYFAVLYKVRHEKPMQSSSEDTEEETEDGSEKEVE